VTHAQAEDGHMIQKNQTQVVPRIDYVKRLRFDQWWAEQHSSPECIQ
jgi:hypothetical protein